jgi:hypothetical protein
MENPLNKLFNIKSKTKDPEKIKYENYFKKEIIDIGKLAIRNKLTKERVDKLITDYKKFYVKYPHKNKIREQESLDKLERIKAFAK